MGAFEDYAKHVVEDALLQAARSLSGLPPLPKPPTAKPKMYKWRCTEDHVRCMQDIFGKVEFKKGQIIESMHSTSEGLAWVVDPAKFERVLD